jgi:hypothetical protein
VKAFYGVSPHFRLPPNLDGKIWRYCDLAKLITILENKALFFPSAASLPDPFEGLFSRPTATQIRTRADASDLLGFYSENKNNVFVNSWHMNEFESDAMWRLYATAEGGVAIQSRVSLLIAALPPLEDDPSAPMDIVPQVFVGTVKYIDYESEDMDSGNIFQPFLVKRKHFDHERELRGVMWRPEEPEKRTGLYVDIDLDELIERLYIAPAAPRYYVDAVTAVCRAFGIQKPVAQSNAYMLPDYYVKKP